MSIDYQSQGPVDHIQGKQAASLGRHSGHGEVVLL